jgi:hypothetical protein
MRRTPGLLWTRSLVDWMFKRPFGRILWYPCPGEKATPVSAQADQLKCHESLSVERAPHAVPLLG